MKRLVIPALVFVCASVSALAQTPPPGQQQPPPKPAPTQPAPQPKPAAPAPQTPAPPQQPPAPFPEGAKIAYVDVQRIATESAEGKAATAKLDALRNKKTTELNDKNKKLQADQQRLQTQSSVLNAEAQAQLQKDIEKQNVEIQRFTQDAQAEVQELQQELQLEFQKKLFPIFQKVVDERKLYMLLSAADSGILAVAPGLDITADVIKMFDAGAKPAGKQ